MGAVLATSLRGAVRLSYSFGIAEPQQFSYTVAYREPATTYPTS
jgi:hypothetical protein